MTGCLQRILGVQQGKGIRSHGETGCQPSFIPEDFDIMADKLREQLKTRKYPYIARNRLIYRGRKCKMDFHQGAQLFTEEDGDSIFIVF